MNNKLSNREIVENDKKNLYLGNLNTVEFDLKLPLVGEYGSSISWESGHEGLLMSDGTVRRPSFGMGNRTVELTGTFSYGDVTEKKVYEVTILQEKKDLRIKKIYAIHKQVKVKEDFYLPETIPADTEDGDTIMCKVIWEGGRKQCLSSVGKVKINGDVAGASDKAEAFVEVVDELCVSFKDKTPCLRSLAFPEQDSRVYLEEGSVFFDAQERMHQVLLEMNDDQMLYNFREASGLDTMGAPQMIGWDTPDSQLRGHTTGHYLSALALCYHATADEKIFKKLQYMVDELKKCQDAFAASGETKEGFLSGYSEEQFDLLEVYTVYPTIWAPYYTLHKILAGLLDCWRFAKVKEALNIADKLGDWTYNRLNRLTKEQRDTMWGMYIAGEIGGINESLAALYEETGNENHLKAARMFDNEKLFLPMEMQVDALSGLHANQHIPQIIGAMKIFEVTGEKNYYDIARYFWSAVTKRHIYAIGGTGEAEMFHPAGEIGKRLTKSTAESCASYNMLKLTQQLYQYEPYVRMMDYYERTVLNHTVASAEKGVTGANTYFMPLAPGSKKEFDDENSCCHGTGLESQSKYIDSIYYKQDNVLFVNLFIASRLEWREKGINVVLKTQKENPGKVSLIISAVESGITEQTIIKIRKPSWNVGGYDVWADGVINHAYTEEDGYIQLIVEAGVEIRQIDIDFNCSFHIEATPDCPDIVSLFYGPYILAALSEEEEMLELPGDERQIAELAAKNEGELSFHLGGMTWIPFCCVDKESYHLYFRKSEGR